MSTLHVFARLALSGSFPIWGLLPDDHLIKLRSWVAVEQRPKRLVGFVVGGAVVHGHEGFLSLVLHDGGIIAIFQGLQKTASHKALVVCKCFVCPGKPLQKVSILSCLDWRKIDDYYKHVKYLLYSSLLAFYSLARDSC